MENAKENVIKTLEFDSPDQIPTQLWDLPWAKTHYPKELENIRNKFPDDIIYAPSLLSKPIKTKGSEYKIGEYVDEWGCLFENKQNGIIGEVKNPIIKTWDDVDAFQIPNELLSLELEEINGFCKSNMDNFIVSPCCARPFERIQFLRGSENIYMDFYEYKNEFETLLKTIHDFNCKRLESWAKTEVDALFIMDDWGAQNSLLISPEMWREIFKPLYQEYVNVAHNNNKYIFMHSDGNILSIIPDLIEIGVDALNSQIFAMGLNNLNKFKGKITFWGEVDRQHMLPNFSAKEIEYGVKEIFHTLYTDGGIIGQCEFGPGAKPENVYTVFDTWKKILKK
ncbi:MAG: uroporphyrinogen decarboxylase family protein [Bacteroidota bacterium]